MWVIVTGPKILNRLEGLTKWFNNFLYRVQFPTTGWGSTCVPYYKSIERKQLLGILPGIPIHLIIDYELGTNPQTLVILAAKLC